VAISWLFEDEARPDTEAVLERLSQEETYAPGLWELEVANMLLTAEPRGRLSEASSTRVLEWLHDLPIRISPNLPTLHHLLEVGRQYGLTSYDAAYVILAQQLNLPLTTLDPHLTAAARLAEVELLITGPAG
jgi:predicted nucleic acid-binding protein